MAREFEHDITKLNPEVKGVPEGVELKFREFSWEGVGEELPIVDGKIVAIRDGCVKAHVVVHRLGRWSLAAFLERRHSNLPTERLGWARDVTSRGAAISLPFDLSRPPSIRTPDAVVLLFTRNRRISGIRLPWTEQRTARFRAPNN